MKRHTYKLGNIQQIEENANKLVSTELTGSEVHCTMEKKSIESWKMYKQISCSSEEKGAPSFETGLAKTAFIKNAHNVDVFVDC